MRSQKDIDLLDAASNGDIAKVKDLIKAGADVNAKNDNGTTPLHWATMYGHTEVVKVLLKVPEIKINEKNKYGVTPLHLAARDDRTEVVKVLLKVPEIKVNEKSNLGWTPLHSAAFGNSTEVVKVLLKVPGINVNAKDKSGKAPSDWATKEAIKVLLQNGNSNKTDKKGNTISTEKGNPGITDVDNDSTSTEQTSTADVVCNVIGYVDGIGGPLFTVVIIGASSLAIFGRVSWPALFSLGMFIAVFFGASKIVTAITGEEACCLSEKKVMENGKCIAAPRTLDNAKNLKSKEKKLEEFN